MKFLKYPIAEFMTWLDFHLGVMSESKVNDVNYKQTSPDQKYICKFRTSDFLTMKGLFN